MRVTKVMLVLAMALGACTDMTGEQTDDLSSCVSSQGFWKNHDPWPVAGLTLGTVSYTEAQLKSVLGTPVGSNGLVDLAHQLIAAKLNFASGASSPAFSAAIASADALIGSRVVPPVGAGSLPTSTTNALAAQLDAYNSGRLDAGPCVGPQADVAITKTVDNAMPNLGDTITFTVTVSDNGPVNATGVVVDDVLPTGLAFVSATPSQGSYDPASGLWQVGAVTTAAPQTLVVRATVTSSCTVSNTATIAHADEFDPNLGNNAASVVVTPEGADLGLTQTVDNHTPNVGDTISFMIILNDNGPSSATNVTVGDQLPAGLTFVAALPSQGTYDPGTGTWTVGTVTTAAIQTLRIDARVVAASTLANTAAIAHADQADPDPGNNTATVVVSPAGADLAIANAVDNATPNVGDTISFTVILTDHGPSAATNVTVSDVLPAGLTFVAAQPSQGVYDTLTGTWTVGTVTTSAIQTLRIDARVVSPSTQVDTAAISHADQFDPDPANNTATAVVSPAGADLALTNTVNNAAPNVGDTISFMVILSDHGPSSATNVTVSDLLPAGLVFVSAQASEGSYNITTGVWTVGTVTSGVIQTLRIDATVVSASTLVDTAAIAHADQFDPNTGNNAATVVVSPAGADLAITHTVTNATPNVGDTITFMVIVNDNGPSTATNVVVNDTLPAGLTLVSVLTSQGSYNGATGAWTVGTVTTGGIQTLRIDAKVVSGATLVDTAAIAHADQFDPNTGNNAATVVIQPQGADLALTATVSNSTPNVGDTIAITFTLSDNGPFAATNVSVSEQLPAGLTFVSATTSQGSFVGAGGNVVGQWTVGTVSTPATLRLLVTVTGAGASTTNATIIGSDQFDPDTVNNSASVTVSTTAADLALSETVSNAQPNVGDTVVFTITLGDNGPTDATNVFVNEQLPPGLTFVSATPSQGSFTGAGGNVVGSWAVGNVATATTPTLQIAARVTSPGALTASASNTSADQFDPDLTNNSASITITAH